jgi:hypothetical protein
VTRRHVIAGFSGAALAALGLLFGGGFARADTETSPVPDAAVTTTASPLAPIVAEDETLIGNTLFIPLGVRSVGTAAALDYELIPLGGEVLTSVPEQFVMRTADGTEYAGSVRTDEARQVRFEGAADTAVAEVEVTQWRLRMFEEYDTSFSLTEPTTLSDGTRLVVERVLDETVGGLVYFDITTGENHGFGGRHFTGPLLITQGLGWQDVLDADTGGTSFSQPSLSVTVDPIPDPVPIHVVARPWVPIGERLIVFRGGGET